MSYPSSSGSYGPDSNTLMKIVNALALIAALIFSLLLTPYFADLTQGPIIELVKGGYGPHWINAAILIWKLLCFPLIAILLWLIWHLIFVAGIMRFLLKFIR